MAYPAASLIPNRGRELLLARDREQRRKIVRVVFFDQRIERSRCFYRELLAHPVGEKMVLEGPQDIPGLFIKFTRLFALRDSVDFDFKDFCDAFCH